MPFEAFDGIAPAIEIFLLYIADVCKIDDFSDFFKVTILSRPVETVFKFIGLVEMILNRMLVLPVIISMSSIPAETTSSTKYLRFVING